MPPPRARAPSPCAPRASAGNPLGRGSYGRGVEIRDDGDALVAVAGGAVVGRAAAVAVDWRGCTELSLAVQPGYRGRGVGAALWAAVRPRLAGALVEVEVPGADPVGVGFARRRGFAVVQQFVHMELDLPAADPDRLAAAVAGTDLAVFTLAEATAALGPAEADRRLYELNRRLSPDIPGNGDTFPPYEVYAAEVVGADWFRRDTQYVAADGDRWVGLAGVGVRPAEGTASHEFTAVDRGYRRRGAARALKARAALDARAAGLRRLVTGNDETNTAIIRANHALGYTLAPGTTRLHRPAPGS
jgi:GNAT superfamily N-acetyltransferase